MFSSKLVAATLALSAAFVGAQSTVAIDPAGAGLKITIPASDLWWVLGSSNVLAWTCRTTSLSVYTVVITNQDQKVLNGPLTFKSGLANADCTESIMPTNLTPGTGYQISLTNQVNISDVFAISEPFEIKAVGSAFPTITSTDIGESSTSGPGATNTNTASGASQTSGKTGAASRIAAESTFVGMAAVGLLAWFA